MQSRAVHTRLALLAITIVLVAALVGVFAFRRASAEADSVGRTAEIVAVGLDDQALLVALQNERWQRLRNGDTEAAQSATDALVEVRDFDEVTLARIVAARSDEQPGGYGSAIDGLLDRSGHVDPAVLDGVDAARAAVNVGLVHWRQSLVAELEAVIGREGQAAIDEARAQTNEWSTTLRLGATPDLSDPIEGATGAAALASHRETMDAAESGERAAAATAVWNGAQSATADLVAINDDAIWTELVADRDAARQQTRLMPLFVAAATIVALLGLLWVGRRWPAEPVVDPHEIPLDSLVSVEHPSPAVDTEAFEHVVAADVAPPVADERLFVDTGPAPARAHTEDEDSRLFADAPIERPAAVQPPVATAVAGDGSIDTIVDEAIRVTLRPEVVGIDSLAAVWVDVALAHDLSDMIAALIDTSLAYATPDVGVTIIGAEHDLGYLVWVVDDGDMIDEARRDQLNLALGGQVNRDERSQLLRRLSATGERAGATGVDIEILGDDEGGNLARLFVPARHLGGDAPAPEAPQPAADPPDPVSEPADPAVHHYADPLASTSTERLSARLARVGSTPVSEAVATRSPDPIGDRQPTPEAVRPREAVEVPQGRAPEVDLLPVVLSTATPTAASTDAERRALAARRMVEQYRGGVTAALMDAADDIALPTRIGEPS